MQVGIVAAVTVVPVVAIAKTTSDVQFVPLPDHLQGKRLRGKIKELYRCVEVRHGTTWNPIEFEDVRIGDIIRFSDNMGLSFVVLANPVRIKEDDGSFAGNWGVRCDAHSMGYLSA